MKREDLMWLAGLLEGEGSFMKPVPSKPKSPIISISMTDQDVMERVGKLWNVKIHRRPPGGLNHKEFWSCRIHGNPAVDLMKELFPYMGGRRKNQITRALDCDLAKRKGVKRCGTLNTYRLGCRCEKCKLAKREEYLRRRDR